MTNDELDTLEAQIKGEMLELFGAEIIPLYDAAQAEAQDVSEPISTGYADLDRCMKGGLREGDVTVITAIPGEGKTTFARMLTLNFHKMGIPTLWLSYEMTNTELWESFKEMGANPDLMSFVPQSLDGDFEWVIKHMKKAIEEKGVRAIFIDTLGDIEKKREKGVVENYSRLIDQICKELRAFNISQRTMLFEIAHCTKQTRSNTNETNNSDIADSKGIAAAATNIWHIWRDKESDTGSFLKIGKSRRDGTKHGWKFSMRLVDNRLLMEGRHESVAGESAWRQI